MDIFTIRQKLRTTRLSDIALRVTFYARVSTDSDEQLNSLDNQISYYRDYITRNPAWTFIDGYIDEGLSGMTTRKRDNFQRMVQDAKDDKFDLILTKEITRFARNTLDSIRYTRELLSAGVGVFFQNDNINTFDEDSELRLTIMSGSGRAAQAVQPRQVRPPAGDKKQCCSRQQPHLRIPKGQQAPRH